MDNENIEIEVKFSIDPALFGSIGKKLAEIAEFKREFRQIDRYFNAPHRDFLKPKHPHEYLRVRNTEGSGVISYKNVHLGEDGGFLYANEHETEIKEIDQILNILKVLDFKEFLTIDKKRRKYVFKEMLEVVLDEVKDLGYFVEIEAREKFDNLEEARKCIFDFAKGLGIDLDNQDRDGYVLAMMKKKGLR